MNATTVETRRTSAVPTQNPEEHPQNPAPGRWHTCQISSVPLVTGQRRPITVTGTSGDGAGHTGKSRLLPGIRITIPSHPGSVTWAAPSRYRSPLPYSRRLEYQGQDPDYFVRLDNTLYPVVMSGTSGTACVKPSGTGRQEHNAWLHAIATVPLP